MTKEEMKRIFGRDDMVYVLRNVDGQLIGMYVTPEETALCTKPKKETKEPAASKKK